MTNVVAVVAGTIADDDGVVVWTVFTLEMRIPLFSALIGTAGLISLAFNE